MIACICRQIYEEDYADDESLRARIMEEDWRCGQCQLRYELITDDINKIDDWFCITTR